MDVAGLDGGGQRLGIHPREHEHAAVGDILDDGGDEAVGAEAHLGRPGALRRDGRARRGRGSHLAHAASSGTRRTGSPASRHGRLDRSDRVDPAVEDRGSEDGIRPAVADRRDEIGGSRGTARGDDRHRDARGDGA